jgi:hypothetical protein
MKTLSIVLAMLLSASFAANADAIYSCLKDGKKTISDRTCQVYGADENHRFEYAADPDTSKTGLNRSLFADSGQGGEQNGGPCRSDARQFCPGSQGARQIGECLLDHQQEISDRCYDALKQRLQNQQAVQACKRDSEELCAGVQRGESRIVNCLLDHQKELSDACYDALAKRMKARG